MDKNKEKIPFVRAVSLQIQALEPLIWSALGWDKVKYSQYQFNSGIKFIESFTELTAEEKTLLLNYGGSGFWKWWRLLWYTRDYAAYHDEGTPLTENLYLHLHGVDTLKSGEQPLGSFYNNLGFFITEAEATRRAKLLEKE